MFSTTTKLAATLALCAAMATAAAQAEDKTELQLMFVQTAAGIEVDTATKTLRLKDVVPQALYFSDRPERVAKARARNRRWVTCYNGSRPHPAVSGHSPEEVLQGLDAIKLAAKRREGTSLPTPPTGPGNGGRLSPARPIT